MSLTELDAPGGPEGLKVDAGAATSFDAPIALPRSMRLTFRDRSHPEVS
jgi:hypothetical protein